jgi:hypothetical protein
MYKGVEVSPTGKVLDYNPTILNVGENNRVRVKSIEFEMNEGLQAIYYLELRVLSSKEGGSVDKETLVEKAARESGLSEVVYKYNLRTRK